MKPKIVVGIAGGTCSGKTSVSRKLRSSVGDDHAATLQQDSYYRDLRDLTPEERSRWNFDRPEAFDYDLLVDHISKITAGESVKMPVYSFTNHTRTSDYNLVEPKSLVIIEGILVLHEPRVRDFLDFKVFIDEEPDVRFARRLQRDEVERGRSSQSVIVQYLETVRPMHLQFVEPSKRYADIIIPRGGENDAAIEILANHIRSFVS